MSTVIFMLYFWTCDTWSYEQTFVVEQECKTMGEMLRQRKVQGYHDRVPRDQNREYRCISKTKE